MPKWTSVVLEAEETIATLTAEKEELRGKVEAFEEREPVTLVDSAIAIWGTRRGHTGKDRDALIQLARSNREAFVSLYPPMAPGAPPPPATKLLAAGQHAIPTPALVNEAPMTKLEPIPVPKTSELAEKRLAAGRKRESR